MTMKDLGNPTKKEIDDLTTILKDLKKAGHFKAFWSTFQESVTFMQTGAVVVESMWSPAVDAAAGSAVPGPLRGAQGRLPRLGRRQRHPQARRERRDKLAAAYDYLNWWNTPVPAGIMATQGYYNANISASHKGLASNKALGGTSADNYWLKGKAATDAARRPRRQAAASRSAPSATAAPTRTAPAASTPGTRRARTATTCCRSGRSSSPPDRRCTDAKPSTTRRSGRPLAARCTPWLNTRPFTSSRRCLTREHTLRSHRGQRSRERR